MDQSASATPVLMAKEVHCAIFTRDGNSPHNPNPAVLEEQHRLLEKHAELMGWTVENPLTDGMYRPAAEPE